MLAKQLRVPRESLPGGRNDRQLFRRDPIGFDSRAGDRVSINITRTYVRIFCLGVGTTSEFGRYLTGSIRIGGLLGPLIVPIAIWKATSRFSEPLGPLQIFGIPNTLMICGLWGGLIGAIVYPFHDLFTRITSDPPPEPGHINASAIAQWTKTR